ARRTRARTAAAGARRRASATRRRAAGSAVRQSAADSVWSARLPTCAARGPTAAGARSPTAACSAAAHVRAAGTAELPPIEGEAATGELQEQIVNAGRAGHRALIRAPRLR